MRRRFWVYGTCVAACVGCLRPPVDEKVPEYPMKEAWRTEVPEASVFLAGTPDTWWEAFADPILNAIVAEGLDNSPSVAQALARFEEALCMTTITGANQYPQLSLNGYGDRRRIPKDLQTSASVPTGISSPLRRAQPSRRRTPAFLRSSCRASLR